MPEKMFLCCKASIWGIVTAWTQMVFCFWNILTHVESLVSVYNYFNYSAPYRTDRQSKIEERADNAFDVINEISDIPSNKKEETFDYAFLLTLLDRALFISGFFVALAMGVILLKGCKQRHVPYLKAWLIFATISIFWNILYFGLMTAINPWFDIFLVTEVLLFLMLYIFGIWIIYGLVITILTDQTSGGELLPKYEGLDDGPV